MSASLHTHPKPSSSTWVTREKRTLRRALEQETGLTPVSSLMAGMEAILLTLVEEQEANRRLLRRITG